VLFALSPHSSKLDAHTGLSCVSQQEISYIIYMKEATAIWGRSHPRSVFNYPINAIFLTSLHADSNTSRTKEYRSKNTKIYILEKRTKKTG
jgi:hypothetical protein